MVDMRTLLATLLLAGTMLAAERGDWNATTALRAGDKVGVVTADMKRVEGAFTSADDKAIVVDGNAITKDKIVRVYRKAGLSRLTRTAIGAGIGVAAAVIITQTGGKRFENEGGKFGVDDGAWYAIAIGAGAGVGAASGSGYQTIYQRK